MLKDKNGKPCEFQPPRKINGTRVNYDESSITEFRGKMWVTLTPLDDDGSGRIWEFCLDDGTFFRMQ